MAVTTIELAVSSEVASGTTDCDFYVPPSGSIVNIVFFRADAAFSTNSVVRITWKNDHGTESPVHLWTIKGDGEMPYQPEITDTDGVREIAVCLENGDAGGLFMSGYALLKVIT